MDKVIAKRKIQMKFFPLKCFSRIRFVPYSKNILKKIERVSIFI